MNRKESGRWLFVAAAVVIGMLVAAVAIFACLCANGEDNNGPDA